MKIEEQVISLEQAKRLKELGVNEDSYFHWFDGALGMNVVHFDRGLSESFRKIAKSYPAYTVAELGEMLNNKAEGVIMPFTEYYSHTHKKMWRFLNPFTEYKQDKLVTASQNEAQARAEMLIYLLENKLI